MKQFLIILCVAIGAASWHGPVFAENRGGWSGWNKWEGGNEKDAQASGKKGETKPSKTGATEKRFCSYEQSKELLALLKKYAASLEKNPDTANGLPVKRVREKIAGMEEARK